MIASKATKILREIFVHQSPIYGRVGDYFYNSMATAQSKEEKAERRYNEETLAAYLRKGILGGINILRHYAQMAHKNEVITGKEKYVIGLLVKSTDLFWNRRKTWNAKQYSQNDVDIEENYLQKDIDNVSEFIELALLTAHKSDESMQLLYVKINAVINEHNKTAQ